MKISRYKTDEDLENNGVWVSLGEGCDVRVARMNNPSFNEMVRKHAKPNPLNKKRRSSVIPNIPEDTLYEILAETILLDWKGMEDDDGKNAKYSKKKAVEYLKKYKDFMEDILEISTTFEAFREEQKEEDEKNS